MVVAEITKQVTSIDKAANFLLTTVLFILLHISNIIVYFTLDSNNSIMTGLKWSIITCSIVIMILYLSYGNRESNKEKKGDYTGILFTSIVVYIAIWIIIMLVSPDLLKIFKIKMEEYMY